MTNPNLQPAGEAQRSERRGLEESPVRNPAEVRSDRIDRQKSVEEARAKIEAAYKRKRIDLQSNRGDVAEETNLAILQLPVEKLNKEWDEKIQHAPDAKEVARLNAEYQPKIDAAIKSAESYLDRITVDTGRLTPEEVAKMRYDQNQKASLYADLLASGENQDILQALNWAMNNVPDRVAAGKEAFKTLQLRIPQQWPKGDGGLMPLIWMIMSFISREDRLKLTKSCFGQKPTELENFLKTGNTRGVFSVDEMEELLGKKYSEAERKAYAFAWEVQHRNIKQGLELGRDSYGSKNAAGEMLTLGNIGLLLIQVTAGVTIVGNTITDIFQGGKPKSIEGIASAIFKPHNLVAGAALTAVHLYKEGKPWGQTFQSKDTADSYKEKQAYGALGHLSRQNSWDSWNSYFSLNDEAMRVFCDYALEMKEIYKNLDPGNELLREHYDFADYLERESKNPNPKRKADYAALKRNFDQIADKSDIIKLAQIFDHFNFGGQSKDIADYRKTVEKARNYPA